MAGSSAAFRFDVRAQSVKGNLAISLALRDFRRGYRGFWIFLSCLSLGVAAITAVMAFASAILGGIEQDGRAVLGGDMVISTQFRPMSDEQYAFLRSRVDSISSVVELRTLLRAQDADDNTLVELKAVDDAYPLVGAFLLRDGVDLRAALQLRDGTYGAVVDSSLVDSGRVQVGSAISLGGIDLIVSGVIASEPDRIGGGGNFGFWPRVLAHRDAFADSIILSSTSRHQREYRVLLGDAADREAFKADLASMFDEHVWDVRGYKDAAPSLRAVVDRIGVLLSLAGLTTLLIGGVGVSNATRAYMDTRLATIAIFKCIGASARLVLRLYLTQVLLLASAGIVAGIGIGYAAQFLLAGLIQQLVAVPLRFGIDLRVIGIAMAYGYLTALLFSLSPLAAALNTSPRALFRKTVSGARQVRGHRYTLVALALAALLACIAILTAPERRFAIWFVIGVVVAWSLFRVIALLIIAGAKLLHSRRQPVLRLAIANLYRPGSATSDIVLAIGLGLSVLVTVALVSANLDRQINGLIPERAPAFFFLDIQASQHDDFFGLLDETPGVTRVDKMPYLRGVITRIRDQRPEDALLDPDAEWMIDGDRAFTYSTTAPENAELVAGTWWPEDYDGPPLLSIHEDVASSFGLEIGETITMRILGREIVGEVYNVRQLEWESMQLNFAIMLSPQPLRAAPHTYISTLELEHSSDGEYQLQDRIAERFPNVTVVRIKDVLDRASSHMAHARDAARGVSLITVLAGILVLAGVVMSENRRRAYESVLLKTLGASRRYVFGAYAIEYLIQGLITASIATAIGILASWSVLTLLMGWNWTFIPTGAALTAAFGLTASMLIGLLGVYKALKHKPLRYLRNE